MVPAPLCQHATIYHEAINNYAFKRTYNYPPNLTFLRQRSPIGSQIRDSQYIYTSCLYSTRYIYSSSFPTPRLTRAIAKDGLSQRDTCLTVAR